MWETAEKFWKVLKFVGNYLDMWAIALTCNKWLSCVGIDLNNWEMGLEMLETTYVCEI